MFRFFVHNKIDDTHFELSQDTLKHMKVTRVFKEQFICIFESKFYICVIENDSAKIIDILDEEHEFAGEVVIAIALINIKRFEWLIQKSAELGATKIIPVITERVVVKINNIEKKVERWNQIALNASEQSFRNVALKVENPITFKEVISLNIKNKFIAHEKINSKVAVEYPVNSIFMTGPEGGFTDLELEQAIKKGYNSISLGKRILRAETAPLFILSKITQ